LQYRLSIIPYVKRCIKTRVTSSTFHIYLSAPVGGMADSIPVRSVFAGDFIEMKKVVRAISSFYQVF